MIKRLPSTFAVFCDGGSRGNPGPAAIGFVVKDSTGKTLVRKGQLIGRATNNVAEYRAVIEALKWIKNSSILKHRPSTINFFLDSKLIVNQLNGLFKTKKAHLRDLVIQVRQLEKEVGGGVNYRFVRREKNQEADTLVNQSFKKGLF